MNFIAELNKNCKDFSYTANVGEIVLMHTACGLSLLLWAPLL